MGCCSSSSVEPIAPPSAPMTQRVQSSTMVPTIPPGVSVPSTPTLPRPRSRTPSLRQPTHPEEGSSSTPRTRTRSLRQPTHTEGSSSASRTRTRSMPQNAERSSSQDRRRAQTLTPGERNDPVPRMPNPGEREMLGWAMNPQ